MLRLPRYSGYEDGPTHTLRSCDGGALFEPTQKWDLVYCKLISS